MTDSRALVDRLFALRQKRAFQGLTEEEEAEFDRLNQRVKSSAERKRFGTLSTKLPPRRDSRPPIRREVVVPEAPVETRSEPDPWDEVTESESATDPGAELAGNAEPEKLSSALRKETGHAAKAPRSPTSAAQGPLEGVETVFSKDLQPSRHTPKVDRHYQRDYFGDLFELAPLDEVPVRIAGLSDEELTEAHRWLLPAEASRDLPRLRQASDTGKEGSRPKHNALVRHKNGSRSQVTLHQWPPQELDEPSLLAVFVRKLDSLYSPAGPSPTRLLLTLKLENGATQELQGQALDYQQGGAGVSLRLDNGGAFDGVWIPSHALKEVVRLK